MSDRTLSTREFLIAVAAMAAVVVSSNILVQYPFRHWGLGDYLTWGAFSYPLAFLVTDLTVRLLGPGPARRVILVGFVLAVGLSVWLATPRIALASGLAFLTAQFLDVALFQRLLRYAWWLPPFVSSLLSSAIDTVIFFTLAFSCAPALTQALATLGILDACGEGLPWVTFALSDYAVKLLFNVAMIVPYGAVLRLVRPSLLTSSASQGQ